MKTFFICAMLVLFCFQSDLTAQSRNYSGRDKVPRAGETFPAGASLNQFALSEREIDFDSLNMYWEGDWPAGQSFSISASPTGDTLFVGEGGMLDVLDITDPYNPVQIAAIRARAIIDGSYYDPATQRVYLAAYFSGIEVWDVSDFSNPARICRIPTTSYPRGGVFARDNYVYIATVADGFYVADISDLENPVMVGHRAIPGNPLIWNSAFQGNYAYLAADSQGMKVINFTNPANPVLTSTYSGTVTGICLGDTLAFIVSTSPGLRIVNIKNPANISLVGYCSITGNPTRVTVSGDYAFIANSNSGSGGINIVDISNPATPTPVSLYSSFQTYIAGQGDAIGATGGTEGCLVLDISDPLAPVQAYAMPLAGFTYEVAVRGNYGYTGTNGFRVFDLSDKSNPVQVGFDAAQGSLAAIKDTLAIYIPKSMTANNPVQVMNIADPQDPYKIGQYMAPVMTYDLALKGNYAFVGCWWDGFRVIDFSNPAGPVLKSHKFGWYNGAVPGVDFCYVQTLDIYENYLYLADYQPFAEEDTKGLYIFDITDPLNPVFISRFATLMSSAQEIRALGNYVYVADGNGGLEVINVSDPYLPYTEGYCSLPDGATGVDVSWPFVFVSDYILGGVEVVDATLPGSPFVTAYYKPSGVFAEGVKVDGPYAFVGDGVCGFQIYNLLTATGISNPDCNLLPEVTIYPNPGCGLRNISINLQAASELNIRILDLSGKEVINLGKKKMSAGLHHLIFDDRNLKPGIYLLETSNPNSGRILKFIVL